MAYLIDAGILSALAMRWSKSPAYLFPRQGCWLGLVNVAASVHSECKLPNIDHIYKDGEGGGPLVQIHRLVSPKAIVYLNKVRPTTATATRDLGEDESLALLMSDLNGLKWVTLDTKAERRALHELGGERVCSPYEFLIDIADKGLLDWEALQACKRAYEGRMQNLVGLPARLQPRYDAFKNKALPR